MRRGLGLRPRVVLGGLGVVAAALVSGCSQEDAEQWTRWGLPPAASDRAPFMGDLWNGAWLASLAIGVLVWGLILWAIFRYRARHADEIPRQTRYNLPLELLYTVVPFLIIGVLFFFTVRTQDAVNAKVEVPQHTVKVIGQKWSWSFNYMEEANPAVGGVVHDVGTIEVMPDLYLPVGESVRFVLNSADVIHSFWIPAFYFKLDVIPGRTNSFDVTPTRIGTFYGKCAELCGEFHANMLFTVHVVTPAEYNAHLAQLKAAGKTGEITGPMAPNTLPAQTVEEK